jgi:hypothetical protein
VRTEPSFWPWCVAFLVLTMALGCPSPAAQGTIYIDTSRVPATLKPDYESFAVNCSKCHSLARALNAPVTNVDHWDIYVAKMMRTAGSAIHPSEAPRIIRFLHWYTTSYKAAGKAGGSASAEAATSTAQATTGSEVSQ